MLGLPARLDDTRQLATMGQLTETNTAQGELAVIRVSTTTTLAAIVTTHFELRLALCLVDQGLSCHDFLSITCGTECQDGAKDCGRARQNWLWW
jgi:hypothetical protein